MGIRRIHDGGINIYLGSVGIGAFPNERLSVSGNVSVSGAITSQTIHSNSYTGTWNGIALSGDQVSVEGVDIKPKSKKNPKPQKTVAVKPIQNDELSVKPRPVAHPVSLEPKEPLKVSSRLATFTLVAVLKNQGLFEQALEVLDALEEKGESPESISLERDTIHTLIQNSKKD